MQGLIDGDIVLYRTACSAEKDDLGIAIYRVDELLDNILNKTQVDSYKMWLSSSTNFRNTIYPEYKGNRKAERPRHLPDLRNYALEKLGAEISTDGLETDDELTIHHDANSIICSLDKDLLQSPGLHFSWEISGGTPDKRWVKPDTFTTITEFEGLQRLYTQILKGDVSDNIKGAEGIGEVKSKAIVKDCKTEKEFIESCLEHFASEEEFLMNAQCIYLLRSYEDSYLTRYERVINEDNSSEG
jgi:5'-3' exonuclease